MRQELSFKLRRPDPQHVPLNVRIDGDNNTVSADGFGPPGLDPLNAHLAGLQNKYSPIDLYQSFPKFIRRLKKSGDPDPDLALYFRVGLPFGVSASEIQAEVSEINNDPDLMNILEPVAAHGGFRLSAGSNTQGYLAPAAERGVNWDYQTFEALGIEPGEGVKVCLVDIGFDDLHGSFIEPGTTQCRISYVQETDENFDPALFRHDHGTWMLGVLAPKPSAPGPIVGIAHAAEFFVSCVGAADPNPSPGLPTPDAGMKIEEKGVYWAVDDALGADNLSKGDVLIVPVQTTPEGMPIEEREDFRVLYRIAAKPPFEITVVETAGDGANGLINLDLHPEIFKQNAPDESLAVMVGARPKVTNLDERRSNYGDRVDCHSWGDCIYTTHPNLNPAPGASPSTLLADTTIFGGSSGAAAIIGGLVAVAQGLKKAAVNDPAAFIEPLDMRNMLSKVCPPGSTVPGEVGPQPDLMRMLRAAGLLPDVFIRDDILDVGDECATNTSIWASPDIIPYTTNLNPPEMEQKFGAGEWANADLAQQLTQGHEGFLYVRAENLGAFDITPDFEIYWAYPGTFLDAANWQSVGVRSGLVPAKEKVVIGPFPWSAPTGTTHPCLMARAHSPLDPAPEWDTLAGWNGYSEFVRSHNNVAHRNLITAVAISSGLVPTGIPARGAGDARDDGNAAAAWRFNAKVPFSRRRLPTSLRIVPKRGVPRRTQMFLGLPREPAEWFAAQVDRLRSFGFRHYRDLEHLLGHFPGSHAVERALVEIVGDRRNLRNLSREQWLVGPAVPVDLGNLRMPARRSVPLVVGVYLEKLEKPAAFDIEVEQRVNRHPVGRVTLRLAAPRRGGAPS